MIVDKNTKFFLYGASLVHGYHYKARLARHGIKTVAFIDKNAENIQPEDETPIFSLDTLPEYAIHEAVVVITLGNRFSHRSVAKELYEKGFRYILYQQAEIETENQGKMDILFQKIADLSDQSTVEGYELPKNSFEDQNKKYILPKSGDDYQVVFISASLLLHGCAEFVKESDENNTIKSFSTAISTFDHYEHSVYEPRMMFSTLNAFIQGVDKDAWDSLMKHRKEVLIPAYNGSCSQEDLDRSLGNRCDIVQKMEHNLMVNPTFFQNNPSDVRWSGKGQFYITDGNNRALFLFSKGHYFIPCKMSKTDFKQWYQEEKLEKLLKFMKENEISPILPIVHPYFMESDAKEQMYSYMKLRESVHFLFREKFPVSEMSFLDVNSDTGFFAQSWQVMTKETAFYEENQNLFSFCQQVNDLLSFPNLTGFSQVPEREFDITFLKSHTKSPEIWANITKKIMFLDLPWGEDPKEVLKYGFSRYEVLKTVPVFHKFYQVCAFIKE